MSDLSPEVEAELDVIRDRFRDSEIATIFRCWFADVAPVSDPLTGKFTYAQVSEASVLAEVRQAAVAAVKWAMNDNGITISPTVIWFVPETDADRNYVARHKCRDWNHIAFAQPVAGACLAELNEVWLSATLDPIKALVVAAHEVRHLAQHSNEHAFATDPQINELMAEMDARLYTNRVQGAIRAIAN